MRKAIVAMAACVLLGAVVAPAAASVVEYIDTFNGTYVGGPIGPIPSGWTYFGYGPPAWNTQEQTLVLPPNDGSNSATRFSIPAELQDSGFYAIYKAGVSLSDLTSQPIDWNEPVTVSMDVYGHDTTQFGQWETGLAVQGYGASWNPVEWGYDQNRNDEWITHTSTIAPDPGHASETCNLVLQVAFDTNGDPPFDGNFAVFENLRIEYTPVPEPAALALLGLGVLVMIRGRR